MGPWGVLHSVSSQQLSEVLDFILTLQTKETEMNLLGESFASLQPGRSTQADHADPSAFPMGVLGIDSYVLRTLH